MKKFSILLAIAALLLASLACQTVMGGGNAGGSDDGGSSVETPYNEGGAESPEATVPPVSGGDDGGSVTVGGGSPFPMLDDAFNVVSTPTSLTYQTKKTADEMIKFYQDEMSAQGYQEDTSMTTNFNGIVAMFFKGSDGKTVVLGAAPVGDGSLSVTLAYQQ